MQYGSFVGPKTVQVDGVDYTADHILVAVGGKPTVPQMEGAEHCINSNGFFLLEVRCRYCTRAAGLHCSLSTSLYSLFTFYS